MKKCSPWKLIGTELAFFRKTFGRMEETHQNQLFLASYTTSSVALGKLLRAAEKWQQK